SFRLARGAGAGRRGGSPRGADDRPGDRGQRLAVLFLGVRKKLRAAAHGSRRETRGARSAARGVGAARGEDLRPDRNPGASDARGRGATDPGGRGQGHLLGQLQDERGGGRIGSRIEARQGAPAGRRGVGRAPAARGPEGRPPALTSPPKSRSLGADPRPTPWRLPNDISMSCWTRPWSGWVAVSAAGRTVPDSGPWPSSGPKRSRREARSWSRRRPESGNPSPISFPR